MSKDAFLASFAPPEKKKLKKVAVLGFTNSWRLAPFDDPEWEIWGLNELYMYIPRWTRWFEIHRRDIYTLDKNRINDHVERIKKMTVPIYMQQHWEDIPESVEYPLKEVMARFGDATRPYLTNTISYMIALAMIEGFEEIGIFGVDMAHDCLVPDMRVLTADLKWIRADQLRAGQELLAFDEHPPVSRLESGTAEFRKYRKAVVQSVSELTLPCYQLTMSDGTELVCSANHPWLTMGANVRRWLTTEQLQDAETHPQRPSKIVKLMETWEEDRSWNAGYLAAAFDGEGHVSQGPRPGISSTHMSVGFSQKLNGMSEAVERELETAGVRYARHGSPESVFKYQVSGGRSELLRFLGSIRPRRLMQKFDANQVGTLNAIDNVTVVKKKFIGNERVIGMSTDTKTIIVEGFASHNTEYGTQRPSCEYYIGMARGMGIKVTIPPESDLLKAVYLYGYQDVEEAAFRAKLNARKGELGQKAQELEVQIQNLTAGLHQYRGAMQDVEHILKIWSPNTNLTVGNNEYVDKSVAGAIAQMAAAENEKEKELAKAAQA
jgi:hypothetical protein